MEWEIQCDLNKVKWALHTTMIYYFTSKPTELIDSKAAEVIGNPEDEEKELEHCSLQENFDNEFKELDNWAWTERESCVWW